MFIHEYEKYKTHIMFSPLEKQSLKEEIQNIMKMGGKYFTYPCYRHDTGTHSEGYIYNANYYKIGEVIGILPICLRAICGDKVEGIKPPENVAILRNYIFLYPLEECLKILTQEIS